LQPLVGKSMALVTDARLSGRNDKIAVLERVLSITGEDPQDVHRKFLTTLTAIRLLVRFVAMTNELPQVQDAAGALATRVILLVITGSFLDREDAQLTDRLLSELSGIFNWALAGLQRLRSRGRFLQPASGRELIGELQDLSSPIAQFVRECCVVSPAAAASPDQLYLAWKTWCQSAGRDHPGTKQTFCRDLRTVCPMIRESRPGHTGPRPRIYCRIALKGCWPGSA
jgi:putative DNA primase/helicase